MIPVRYQAGQTRAVALSHALATDHPLVGGACPGCDVQFEGGEMLALVYVGPGGSAEEQHKARRGSYHVGAAVALHVACAGLEEAE